MSKISNAIKMLDMLNTGNKYTVKELSEIIGVTPRMIRYYKEELVQAGFLIETFMGPNGGYFLLKNGGTYNQFNKYDLQLLTNAYEMLKLSDYMYIKEYENLINKVSHVFKIEEEKSKIYFDNYDEINSNTTNILKNCIKSKERIKVIYLGVDGKNLERWIHPLYIFKYHDSAYLTAFCELRNAIRHFNIDKLKIIEN